MARREKDLQSGMNSMMGYATQAEQNKPADDKPRQTAPVQSASQKAPEQAASVQPATRKDSAPAANNEKKKTKYLRLDITGLEDYVSLMAEHLTNTSGDNVSMTKYIRQLIEADMQQNSELYGKLMQIENMKREVI